MLMPMYKLKQANPDRPSFPYHAWFVFYSYCYVFLAIENKEEKSLLEITMALIYSH